MYNEQVVHSSDAGERVDIIPEGWRFMFLHKLTSGKYNQNPSGKMSAADFSCSLNFEFLDAETGLFIKRIWKPELRPGSNLERMILWFSVRNGGIQTVDNYFDLMEAFGCKPVWKSGNSKAWHIYDPKTRRCIYNPFDAADKPGPVGLPIMMKVVHREKQVFQLIEGAVKNQYNSYDDDQYVPAQNEDGSPKMAMNHYLDATVAPEGAEFKEIRESGWFMFKAVPEEYKDRRHTAYWKPEISLEDAMNASEPDVTREDQVAGNSGAIPTEKPPINW